MERNLGNALFAAEAPLTSNLLAAAASVVGLGMPSFQEDLRRHAHVPPDREGFMTDRGQWLPG